MSSRCRREIRLRGGGVGPAMVGVDMTGFRPVKFAFGQVHFSGGHGGKPLPMPTKTVSNDTFVKMSRTETWLVFATTGQNKCTQGSFGRTSLVG